METKDTTIEDKVADQNVNIKVETVNEVYENFVEDKRIVVVVFIEVENIVVATENIVVVDFRKDF